MVAFKRHRAPHGFNKAVMQRLGRVKVSSAYITMVKKGKRNNDAVLMAIIEVDKLMNKNIPAVRDAVQSHRCSDQAATFKRNVAGVSTLD